MLKYSQTYYIVYQILTLLSIDWNFYVLDSNSTLSEIPVQSISNLYSWLGIAKLLCKYNEIHTIPFIGLTNYFRVSVGNSHAKTIRAYHTSQWFN